MNFSGPQLVHLLAGDGDSGWGGDHVACVTGQCTVLGHLLCATTQFTGRVRCGAPFVPQLKSWFVFSLAEYLGQLTVSLCTSVFPSCK